MILFNKVMCSRLDRGKVVVTDDGYSKPRFMLANNLKKFDLL